MYNTLDVNAILTRLTDAFQRLDKYDAVPLPPVIFAFNQA